ncbi:MAG TPA: lipopolysaccharide transport periplasmic protein LptA [Steroidobacteraceae bacterium]|nr:lipopolysaccharide transport periplasmic protein LptA [Steroidobacteraceae bacterium]
MNHRAAQSVYALCCLLLLGADKPARIATSRGPITYDAASVDVDYRTQQVVLRDVVITQGDLRVQADRAEATGLNFDDSHWVFTGNVHIRAEQRGTLQSERATVEFRHNQIEKAIATGTPAQFEEKLQESGLTARGHAGSIEYDVGPGTVRLTNDAWLTDGRNEMKAPTIVYDINQRAVQSHSEGTPGSRVHITILPKPEEHRGHTP